ncbi:MAG: hypothetical protein HQ512_07335 [Rhodospirillales bacterium]|nr:hypothetical protein [Rhodospirillales bacterium]
MRVQEKSFYADLFTDKSASPRLLAGPAALKAPEPEAQVAQGERAQVSPKGRSPLAQIIGVFDAHHATPRQVANLSDNLYAAGAISFDDYSELAFQPDLDPEFERTIGALTGEPAEPDRPRDFVSLWDERAAFEKRHKTASPDMAVQSERIAALLRGIETPTNLIV